MILSQIEYFGIYEVFWDFFKKLSLKICFLFFSMLKNIHIKIKNKFIKSPI